MTYMTFSQHNCTKQHRTWHQLARCMFPHATRITGEGEYAAIAHCGTTTIDLFEDPVEAQAAKGTADYYGCGARCFHRHQTIQLTATSITWTTG